MLKRHGPRFRIVVDAVAATVAQDVIEIVAPATASVILHSAFVNQDAQDTSEVLPFQVHRTTAAGSGGSAVVPNRVDLNTSVYNGTAARNNTTRGTEGEILHRESSDIKDGFYFEPIEDDDKPVIPPGGRLVIGLESAPTASITISAVAIIEEISQEIVGKPRSSQY